MQRIRVGLTGLAMVLLLVALATALVSRVGVMPGSDVSQVAKSEDKGEPLAELGVAPAAPQNESQDKANQAKP